jgi:hypothetical protein
MSRKYLVGVSVGVVLLTLNALSTSLAAQDRSRIWLGVGLGGAGGSDEAGGAALMAEIVFQTTVHQFTVRAMGAADPFGEGGGSFGEVGVLYGRGAKRTWGHAAISAGLAWTALESCRSAGGRGCSTIGVPLVAEAAVRVFSIMGVGVQGFANFNSQSIFRGAVLFLQLGWLPQTPTAGD